MAQDLRTAIKGHLKRCAQLAHEIALRFGIIAVPSHYYSDLADLRVLRKTQERWARRSALTGIAVEISDQVENLRDICVPFRSEYEGNSIFRKASEMRCGPGFGYIEAQALHSVIRYLKPRTIVEVGCGVSTYCMLEAMRMNAAQGSSSGEVICIEPNPRDWLRHAPVKLLAKPVQEVPIAFFENCEPGTFLFIDSTHTVKTGSDVNYLILEILPRLQPGVFVHFHDIFLPYDYGPGTLQSFFQAQETALLHAFLIGNENFRILFCLSMLHHEKSEVLGEVFDGYLPRRLEDGLEPVGTEADERHFPSSIYLEKI